MLALEALIEKAVSLHGHGCPGQVLGVRMAVLGCSLVGVDDPAESKDLIVYVETDRCAVDAIQAATGCKLGKRTLKFVDYGKVAATFVNVTTGDAVRVVAREDAREAVGPYAPPGTGGHEAQIHAYKVMPDEKLFVVSPVRLEIAESDMPGCPISRVLCESCGEGVNDRREVVKEGRVLCIPCAYGAYYLPIETQALQSSSSPDTGGHGTERNATPDQPQPNDGSSLSG